MRTSLLTALALALSLAACGGSTSQAPAPTPAPATPTPPPAPVVEEAPNPHEGWLWYVYWEGIHCLTVYPQPGLIRSEESSNANATFRSRNPYFSIISVYYEREDEWTPEIEAATSVDDLLDRFRAMPEVEVERAENPVQSL